MSKFKVGDRVRGTAFHDHEGSITRVASGIFGVVWDGDRSEYLYTKSELELIEESQQESSKAPVSGGPSKYYDYPFNDWTTGNDMMEYFATEVWGAYSLHFKDIFKAGLRWGNKSGTTEEYDARKIVYSGLRLLGMISGKQAVADYLKELSEDKQFQGED